MAEKTNQDYINELYDSSLESQKQTLQQNQDQGLAELDRQQQAAQKRTDVNLTDTYVEAAKKAKNYNEVQNAYGLTSGAMAQAKLAQDNQLRSDMATIRASQQETDAEIERQRGILGQQFASEIAKAQADNDMARAQALYEEAEKAEQRLLQQQKEAAGILGAAGDFSMHGSAYGMTAEQVANLQSQYEKTIAEEEAKKKQQEQAVMAEILASMGNYSGYEGLYGITAEQAAGMQGKYDSEQAKQAQKEQQAEQAYIAELLASSGDYSGYNGLYGMTAEQAGKLQAAYDKEIAKQEAAKQLAKQEAAAQLMAGAGDYSIYQSLYGLTPEQAAKLEYQFGAADREAAEKQELARQEAAAELMASFGDYSLLAELYGLTPEQVKLLQGGANQSSTGKPGSIRDTGLPDDDEDEEVPSVDLNSVKELGFGDLTPEQLAILVAEGYVEAKEEGDRLVLSRTDKNGKQSGTNMSNLKPSRNDREMIRM